jgi:hypothetical protein
METTERKEHGSERGGDCIRTVEITEAGSGSSLIQLEEEQQVPINDDTSEDHRENTKHQKVSEAKRAKKGKRRMEKTSGSPLRSEVRTDNRLERVFTFNAKNCYI